MKRILLGLLGLSLLFLPASAQTYPRGAFPVFGAATGTTASFSATLPAVAGRTTYICGFVITGGGSSVTAVGQATVTGMVGGGTASFTYVDVSSGQGVLGIPFPVCQPASGPNTTIVVTKPAGGTGTVAAIWVWGYQL